MSSLSEQLRARAEASAAKTPEPARAVMARALRELEESGLASRARDVGDRAPTFTLPDARGGEVSLEGLLAEGPVVISFYRGGWCPYCNLELQALQESLDGFAAAGATLVAISPNPPDGSLSTVERHGLAFPVLSDVGNTVAREFGLVFTVPDDLAELYRKIGFDVGAANGDGSWDIPIPATYVVDTDGRIVFAFVDPDYRRRAEPADVIAAVAALRP